MGSKTSLRYHLILTTKYRRPALSGIEDAVYAAMREVESASDFRILAMGIEDGNHIHLVIKMAPKHSVSAMVNRIKGMTLSRLWESEAERLRQFYWGPKRMLWHGSYYCSTVGDVSTDKVLDYVRAQGDPAIHRRR